MDLSLLTMEEHSNQNCNGSMHLKQDRSGDRAAEEPWKATKIFKPNNEFDFTNNNNNNKDLLAQTDSSLFLRSGSMVSGDDGQTMLCFSSSSTNSKAQQVLSRDSSSRCQDFPIFQAQQTPFYAKGSDLARCHEGVYGPFSRLKGPFTPSQWMELEHQALIYKHILANVPIPSNLLIPLKKSLNPYAFSSFSSGSYVNNSFGWGSFRLGYSGNTDPEPGRCRRTDGKKWRCSRDAVPDQKYCERHINRGRHRSRKPVEGQTGHAVSGSTTKVVPIPPSSALAMSSGGASISLGAMQHQLEGSQTSAANPSTVHLINRIQDPNGFSTISPTADWKCKDSSLSVQKQQVAIDKSSQPEFGFVSSDSLLNPSQKTSFLNSGSSTVTNFSQQETHNQHPFRHFIDNWPKNQSDRGSVAWPGEVKSDWTQLSMSIPMTSSDFSSSSNSPQQKKLTLSPLRLAGEFDPFQMSLSVTSDTSEPIQKQTHWLPVSWGNSMGGPLGEVLNTNTAGGNKSSSALNLVTEGWDSRPHLESSPTGVLQKSTFTSLSNSSAGSSPRCDNNKVPEAASFCDDMLGSTLASSSCIPSL